MGEVRVKVKLINRIDNELVNRGLLNPTNLRVYEALALIDTGAARAVIPMQIVQMLGLRLQGQQLAKYADGREETLSLTEPVIIEMEGKEVAQPARFCRGRHVNWSNCFRSFKFTC